MIFSFAGDLFHYSILYLSIIMLGFACCGMTTLSIALMGFHFDHKEMLGYMSIFLFFFGIGVVGTFLIGVFLVRA
jgi:hypothetical protein